MVCLSVGGLVSGCQQSGTSAQSYARRACADVARSIVAFDRSKHASTPSVATSERDQALTQLRLALGPAGLAAAKDTAWDALVTTLSETSDQVPEASLIHALTQQCAPFS